MSIPMFLTTSVICRTTGGCSGWSLLLDLRRTPLVLVNGDRSRRWIMRATLGTLSEKRHRAITVDVKFG